MSHLLGGHLRMLDSRISEKQAASVASPAVEPGLRRDAISTIEPFRPRAESAISIRSKRATVLVAEDNLANRAFIEAVLLALAVDVVSVSSGAAAVQAVQGRRFDAVLMDCYMPGLDGLQATRLIRQHERLTHSTAVPVIALTAAAMQDARRHCVDAGMTEFIAKPFNIDYLQLLLRRVLPHFALNFDQRLDA
jgi:two-component system sensor histidine kinase BarA